MTTREHVLEYIAWNERMIKEFSTLDNDPKGRNISVRLCEHYLADLRKRLESGNYDPLDLLLAGEKPRET